MFGISGFMYWALVRWVASYCFFVYECVRKLPATKASVFTIFEPLTAIILAMVMLGQSLSPVQGVGVGIILLAALLNAVLAN